MSESVSPLVVYRKEEFLSSQTLERADEAVDELFGSMLGLSASAAADQSLETSSESLDGTPSDVWATIRFAGPMRGACEVRMSPSAAGFVTSLMLGEPVAEDDDSIGDTVGEICNIVGGGWKNRTFDCEARCTLTPPTVQSGADHVLGTPSAHLRRTYLFEEHSLRVTLTRDEMAA